MAEKKPPREVTFPIRPHWFSVGLFTAGILRRIRTGQDEETQICHRPARVKGQPALIIDQPVSSMFREYAAVQV